MALADQLNQALSKVLAQTDESKDIAMLVASIIHQPEPDNLKVDMIKEAIQWERYQINPENIADKLLEFVSVIEQEDTLCV